MDPDLNQLLKSTALFSSCNEEDLAVIASYSGFLHYPDSEAVFSPGDKPDRLYIVRDGEIVIRKDDDEGTSLDIARFLQGGTFGELDMFTRELRNASAVASGDVSLLVFPYGENSFNDILINYPRVSARLLHAFLVQVSARIRGVNTLVKENSPLVQELKRQVYADKLTGLNNKTSFEETLGRILSSRDKDGSTGLLMYKPDNFKVINDHYGHDSGDKVLRFIADGLCELVEDRDMLFRYMGNENALILPGIGREELQAQAEKIGDYLRSINLKEILGDDSFRLSVSFGLGMAPDHGSDAVSLIDAVHPLALEGRRRGGNCCLFPEDFIEV